MELPDIYSRTRLLVGKEGMEKLQSKKVIVFGCGGVGSWCIESLLRSGITDITIVDPDEVCASNVNRQLMATCLSLGQAKVEAMKERLLAINPEARITAIQKKYGEETAGEFDLDSYEYVIDCIDSLKDKIELMVRATASKATLFSSLGAALKTDPCKVRVAPFWKVRGCPLGAMLRKRMHQRNYLPSRNFLCVYDEEVLENKEDSPEGRVNGTFVHITAIFGFTIAGLVIEDILKN